MMTTKVNSIPFLANDLNQYDGSPSPDRFSPLDHIYSGSRIFHMWCELTETGQTFERFTVWPRDNPYKTIVLQNNRPLVRKKLKLKTKPYDWKVVSGDVRDRRALDQTIAVIESYIEENLKYRGT